MEEPKLSLVEMQTIAAGGKIEPVIPPVEPVVPPVEPVIPSVEPVIPPVEPVIPPVEPVVPPVVQVEDPLKPGFDTEGKEMVIVPPAPPVEPKANPMKEIRDNLKKEKDQRALVTDTIQKFSEGEYKFNIKDFKTEDGKVDYAALSSAMEDVDVATRAETKGLTPEIQAEVERIEKEKVELQKQRLQISMDKALTNLQMDRKLQEGDINNFFKDAMADKKNPYQWIAQGGTLGDLYSLIYADKLKASEIATAVAAAKAKWDADALAAGKLPRANPGQPTPLGGVVPKDGLTLNELKKLAADKMNK